MTDAVLTVAQVAELVHCSAKTVKRAIDDGSLRASQLAARGVWRILDADVDAWLELKANRPRSVQPVRRGRDLALPVAGGRRVRGGELELKAGMGKAA